MTRPALPKLDEDADWICGTARSGSISAKALIRAVAALEGVTEITIETIRNLGLGTPSMKRLADCWAADERADCRMEIATALARLDTALLRLVPNPDKVQRRRNSMLMIARLVEELVALAHAPDETGGGGGDGGDGRTSYLVTQSEEERSYSLPSYDADDVARQKMVLAQMYNIRVRVNDLPGIGVIKKAAYWVKKELCWPDPTRLGLEKFRHSPADSAIVLFRRLGFTVLVISAGEKADLTVLRDGGAGKTAKFGTQWMNGDKFTDLLAELEERRDALSDEQMTGVTELMHETLHKSTRDALDTCSLSMSTLVAKVRDGAVPWRMEMRDM